MRSPVGKVTTSASRAQAVRLRAGPELFEACLAVPEVRPGVRCPTGEARITPGFRLPAKFVIHTVGPVYRDGRHGEPELLAACYRNSLALAAENNCRSIAFPCISTGVYGYPIDEATRIAIREVQTFLSAAKDEKNAEMEVVFCCFSKRDADAYERLWHALFHGERRNNHHTTLTEKAAAKGAAMC